MLSMLRSIALGHHDPGPAHDAVTTFHGPATAMPMVMALLTKAMAMLQPWPDRHGHGHAQLWPCHHTVVATMPQPIKRS